MESNAKADKAPKANKAQKESLRQKFKGWSRGVKVEFGKIIWPDKKSVGKQTVAVVVISLVLGLIISILDAIIKYGVDFLVM